MEKPPLSTLNLSQIDQYTAENAYLNIELHEQTQAIEWKQDLQAPVVEIRRGLGEEKTGSNLRLTQKIIHAFSSLVFAKMGEKAI